MVVKIYISQVSASNEVKKRQQRAQMILDSLEIQYKTIDVTEPGNEKERDQMQSVCKRRHQQSIASPPQFFNDDTYCGDYEDFDSANDEDNVKVLLKLEEPDPIKLVVSVGTGRNIYLLRSFRRRLELLLMGLYGQSSEFDRLVDRLRMVHQPTMNLAKLNNTTHYQHHHYS